MNRSIKGIATAAMLSLAWTLAALVPSANAITHPGVLHTQADIDRMISKVNASAQPWKGSWDRLVANSHAQTGYTPNPQANPCAGAGGCPNGESFMPMANDCAAAYQCALRYRISGNTAYANKARDIMNAWKNTMVAWAGDSNVALRAGLYGFQWSAAAELLRGYSGWAAADFTGFKNMLLNKFYNVNTDFLVRHNNTCFDHYWANWDLANMSAILGIGVLCDQQAKIDEAINYFYNGVGTGKYNRLCNFVYAGTPQLGQCQESGRDQGHSCLDMSLTGQFCQTAFCQGTDLFAYSSNRMLALFEYTAKYNLNQSVPWTNYTNCENNAMTAISSSGRGDVRPCWELIYNHYAVLRGLAVPSSQQFAANVRPEGGGGDYGTSSGGFDQLGFGTLTCTLDSGGGGGGTIPAGTYSLKNRSSGKMLDNLGATTDGAIVAQWTDGTSNNQKWTLSYVGSNAKLTCVTGGKCLDSLGHTADGSTVGQWTAGGSLNQQWTIQDLGTGYYKVICVANGKCLDTGGGTTDGAQMQFWGSGTSNNQQWQFVAP